MLSHTTNHSIREKVNSDFKYNLIRFTFWYGQQKYFSPTKYPTQHQVQRFRTVQPHLYNAVTRADIMQQVTCTAKTDDRHLLKIINYLSVNI